MYNEGKPSEKDVILLKKKPRFRFERYLIEPIVYKTFARFIIFLTLGLLWNRFVNELFPSTYVFGIFAIMFFIFTWFAYLRMDGVKVPKLDRRLFDRKKKPPIMYGDMSDFVDEERDPFEELEEEEKELCILIADALCGVIFLIISFF